MSSSVRNAVLLSRPLLKANTFGAVLKQLKREGDGHAA